MRAVSGCRIVLALPYSRHRKKKFASAEDRQETDGNIPLPLNASWIEQDERNRNG